jgi:hypothetical protein
MESRSRLTPTSPTRLETESSRLQRDTDTIAERFESERRQAVLLDDNIKTLEVELYEVKERIRSLKAASKQQIQIQILEKRLQLESTKLNEAQAENTKLRDDIDLLRRERMILKDLSSGITKDIVAYSKTAEEKFIDNIQKQEIIAENLSKVKLLRSSSAVNKTRYTRQIRELSVNYI